MKKLISLLLTWAILCTCLWGCSSGGLSTEGCRIISQEDDYVTYQTVCDNCGYEFGDPVTVKVIKKLFYSVTCTRCDEIIYVRIERD